MVKGIPPAGRISKRCGNRQRLELLIFTSPSISQCISIFLCPNTPNLPLPLFSLLWISLCVGCSIRNAFHGHFGCCQKYPKCQKDLLLGFALENTKKGCERERGGGALGLFYLRVGRHELFLPLSLLGGLFTPLIPLS